MKNQFLPDWALQPSHLSKTSKAWKTEWNLVENHTFQPAMSYKTNEHQVLRQLHPFLTILTVYNRENFNKTNRQQQILNIIQCLGFSIASIFLVFVVISAGQICVENKLDMKIITTPLALFIGGSQMILIYLAISSKSRRISAVIQQLNAVVMKRKCWIRQGCDEISEIFDGFFFSRRFEGFDRVTRYLRKGGKTSFIDYMDIDQSCLYWSIKCIRFDGNMSDFVCFLWITTAKKLADANVLSVSLLGGNSSMKRLLTLPP